MSLTHESVEDASRNWHELYPRLDTSTFDVFGQISAIQHSRLIINERIFEQFGITRADFQILALLIQRRRPLTPSEISEQCQVTGAATTKRLRRLEANEMILREVNPEDGRGWLITPTRQIVENFGPLLEAVSTKEHELLSGLTEGERQEITALLLKLRMTVEKQRDLLQSS